MQIRTDLGLESQGIGERMGGAHDKIVGRGGSRARARDPRGALGEGGTAAMSMILHPVLDCDDFTQFVPIYG